VWIPAEGYLIEAIEQRPGQPQLQEGDVLRWVGDTCLSGFSVEAQADAALASSLRDGMSATAFRPAADPRSGDVVRASSARAEMAPLWLPSVAIGTWSWGNEDFGGSALGADRGRGALLEAFGAALDAGACLFDTAPTYGKGFAEVALGKCLASGRYALIATKYYPRGKDRDMAAAMIVMAQQSISRLRPAEGCLDLFQLHRVAEPPHSLEEQADGLAAVVRAGLARAVGVCNCSLEELRRIRARLWEAHGLALSTCQVELSLVRQLPCSSGLVAACRSMGVAVLAYSPLAMGRLSGRFDPFGGAGPRWGRDGSRTRPFGTGLDAEPPALARLLAALREVGQRHGKSCAQVALNWVLCQGAIPISGARSCIQAMENSGAMGWRLSPEEVALLTALGARGATSEYQHG